MFMAIIQCKHCGKDVSDKARNCPHCGEALIENTNEATRYCGECNSELPNDAVVCPNCGCPVPEKEEVSAQKVEVTAVKFQVKESTKKYVAIGVIVVIAIAIIGIIVSNDHENNLRAEYSSNMELASYTMLSGAAEAEDAGNLIKRVWYNAIYEERDSETDKYTRPNGYFVDDFNEALATLLSDTDFKSSITSIKDNQNTVSSLMKQLKNPPEEYEEAYDALKKLYDAYLELTSLATNPTGSLQSYSSNFNDADSNALNCYKAFILYIE